MHHTLKRLKQIFPGLNRWEFTELDCWQFVERKKILVRFAPLTVHGYYGKRLVRNRKRDYILLDERLKGIELLKTFLHEIGHICLHEPSGLRELLYLRRESVAQSRQEIEADLFMLYSLIPLRKLREYEQTPFDELHPMTVEMLKRRQYFYEQLGE